MKNKCLLLFLFFLYITQGHAQGFTLEELPISAIVEQGNAGDVASQYYLAYSYYTGQRVGQDF